MVVPLPLLVPTEVQIGVLKLGERWMTYCLPMTLGQLMTQSYGCCAAAGSVPMFLK